MIKIITFSYNTTIHPPVLGQIRQFTHLGARPYVSVSSVPHLKVSPDRTREAHIVTHGVSLQD